jgi:2-amino-4-hydroxy-6-hydroxymethyldihydropteridine diphosphokinase
MEQPFLRGTIERLILVALGSNGDSPYGGARATVQGAGEVLRAAFGDGVAISRLFATPAFPAGSGPDFVNAAAAFHSAAAPGDILTRLHEIEAEFGRTRRKRWGKRSLDLDLIAVGDLVLPDPITQAHWRDLHLSEQQRKAPEELILPHPRIQDRAFVLVPLADVADGWRHPELGLTVAQMYAACPEPEIAGVKPL